jgi:hypothetical protein
LFWLQRGDEKDILGMTKREFGRKMLWREECGKRIQKKRMWEKKGKVFEGRKKDFLMKRDKKKNEWRRKRRFKEIVCKVIFLFLSFLFRTIEIYWNFLFQFLSTIYDSFG